MATKRANMDKKVSELVHKTKLSRPVVQNLMHQYSVLCSVDRVERDKAQERENVKDALMDSFGIQDIFLLDRIYRTFNTANTHHLTLDDYVHGMAMFLSGDLEKKTAFCFKVYDVNGDGYLSKEEMYQFLKDSMVTKSHDLDQDDGEEGIKELTDMVLKLLDCDHDGRVSFADFKTAVDKNKLALQILGKCLPDERCRCDNLRMLGEPDLTTQPVTISSKKQAKKQNSPRKH